MLYLHSTKTKVIWDAPQARSWRVPTTHVRSPKAFSDGTNGGFIIGYIPLISPFEMAKLYPLSIYITFYSNYIPLYPLKFSILSQLHAITPWYPHSAWLNHVKSPPSHQTPREEWWKRRLTAPQRGHGNIICKWWIFPHLCHLCWFTTLVSGFNGQNIFKGFLLQAILKLYVKEYVIIIVIIIIS